MLTSACLRPRRVLRLIKLDLVRDNQLRDRFGSNATFSLARVDSLPALSGLEFFVLVNHYVAVRTGSDVYKPIGTAQYGVGEA